MLLILFSNQNPQGMQKRMRIAGHRAFASAFKLKSLVALWVEQFQFGFAACNVFRQMEVGVAQHFQWRGSHPRL